MMGLIEVILTVCAVSNPTACGDRRFQFAGNGSPSQCAMVQPSIAAWIGDHPDWTVKEWSCGDPGKRKQAI
jgi:hypothetical protein